MKMRTALGTNELLRSLQIVTCPTIEPDAWNLAIDAILTKEDYHSDITDYIYEFHKYEIERA